MAKREDFSQGSSPNNSSDSNSPDTSATAFQLAQANTRTEVFDLANSPVKATFTSTKTGSSINLYLVQADGSVVII